MTKLVSKTLQSQIRNQIIAEGGSVQNVVDIPSELKEIYRTVWELKQRSILDMAADRGIYVDQSQSLNIFVSRPDYAKLTSLHFHGWKRGLKTGMYYLRTQPAARAIQFTVDQTLRKSENSRSNTTINDLNVMSNTNISSDTIDGGTYGEVCDSCSG
jgi:ribonucleoside-diphosphate reductase subunit M1